MSVPHVDVENVLQKNLPKIVNFRPTEMESVQSLAGHGEHRRHSKPDASAFRLMHALHSSFETRRPPGHSTRNVSMKNSSLRLIP